MWASLLDILARHENVDIFDYLPYAASSPQNGSDSQYWESLLHDILISVKSRELQVWPITANTPVEYHHMQHVLFVPVRTSPTDIQVHILRKLGLPIVRIPRDRVDLENALSLESIGGAMLSPRAAAKMLKVCISL